MKASVFVLGAAIALTGFPLTVRAQVPVEDQAVKPVPVGNTICPVSGEKIAADSGMAPVTYEYKGKVYNLCCAGCVDMFKADPEKYSKIADQEAGKDKDRMADMPASEMPAGHKM